ncbi:hypothetical protein SADUNF_Sadunf02G0169100 [Salix dunnii]|uniref:INO80 complex subunit B-like conserved region domain-containing protein n=1 Tax=Salix dunnii TaxID=1413687 RepID=A0A835N8R6_9ROSI|nr:hypothetical protein SADUNF_Sadunf02G0169100 [Salix dunnii]
MENKREIITSPSPIRYLSHSSFSNPSFLSLYKVIITLTKDHQIFLPLLFLSSLSLFILVFSSHLISSLSLSLRLLSSPVRVFVFLSFMGFYLLVMTDRCMGVLCVFLRVLFRLLICDVYESLLFGALSGICYSSEVLCYWVLGSLLFALLSLMLTGCVIASDGVSETIFGIVSYCDFALSRNLGEAPKDWITFHDMEVLGLSQFETMGSAIRKKRSHISRRPKDSQTYTDNHDYSSLSISPPSGDGSKGSSDENVDNSRRKELILNQSVSRDFSATRTESENVFYDSNSGKGVINNKRFSEGALAPANRRSTNKLKECMDVESRAANVYSGRNDGSWSSEQSGASLDALGNENKVKKVKCKVGGAARTINPNSTTNGVSSTENPRFIDTSRSRKKLSLQGGLEEDHFVSGRRPGLQGVPWKEFSREGFSIRKEDCSLGMTSSKNTAGKQGDKPETVRKSKRAPKRRVLVEGDDDEDDEIRYLEKLKSKVPTRHKEDDGESSKKQLKLSTLENNGTSRPVKDGKKISRSHRAPEDGDNEEEESLSNRDFEGSKKKQKNESIESLTNGKKEMTLTKRQQALQSSKDGSSVPDANLIEFPNGLPPAPSKKQKDKLTEIEQQLKKSEAAERRRLQVEKAARESEAEAIRKIRGQDSSRKKQEDKMKKRLEELAQEKAVNAQMLASSTIRWVMGPTGTVVTFPKDMGLPSIFDSKPCSYPPPREKCAGPSCSNPYRYRDSKSKIPLCSLQCYKAMEQEAS